MLKPFISKAKREKILKGTNPSTAEQKSDQENTVKKSKKKSNKVKTKKHGKSNYDQVSTNESDSDSTPSNTIELSNANLSPSTEIALNITSNRRTSLQIDAAQLSHPLEYSFQNLKHSTLLDFDQIKEKKSFSLEEANALLDIGYLESLRTTVFQASFALQKKIENPPKRSFCRTILGGVATGAYVAYAGYVAYNFGMSFLQSRTLEAEINTLGNFLVANCSSFITYQACNVGSSCTNNETLTSCNINYGQIDCAPYLLDTCTTCNSSCSTFLDDNNALPIIYDWMRLLGAGMMALGPLLLLPLCILKPDCKKPGNKSVKDLLGDTAQELDKLMAVLHVKNDRLQPEESVSLSNFGNVRATASLNDIQEQLEELLCTKIIAAKELRRYGIFKQDALEVINMSESKDEEKSLAINADENNDLGPSL